MLHLSPSQASSTLDAGGVIAYPTEAVFGLGCDPNNRDAIEKILQLKRRPWEKGLILVASDMQQLDAYVDFSALTLAQLAETQAKWPGPFTFLMPKSKTLLPLLCGQFETIAVRVSAHPVVREICDHFGGAIVSTSANHAGEEPALTVAEIESIFEHEIDAVITGALGDNPQPSTIIDIQTGKILRS
ncbi:L-threonylcarbamoyladenylate synthase [Shewanella gelidii]|uniref:Threonylcarbamoyl-AMP synthase n=1 Tax=Shewanella gelidii TaxID=1642821 RepID=A0A917JXR5_9GAMM|nr:L-threonylcarbamoyladenylate synthase [Shewanella gelidii]MCL1099442.1 threonylcarbamoyl-AMP synthase [Shewanella gelidii]GGI91859.1 threonylcarbamoyl-AMP synthase [Shewanella gelidii]